MVVYGRDGVWYPSVNVRGFTYFCRLDPKARPLHSAMVMHVLGCRLDSKGSNRSAVGVLQKLLPIPNIKLSELGSLMIKDGICFPLQEWPHLSVTEYQD